MAATATNTTATTSRTIDVPHLGGIRAGYAVSGGEIDPAKPTFVLVNAMFMTSALYDVQFADGALTGAANLVAVEPLGHGATTCATEHFTFWDSAVVALHVMDGLGLERAYALGTGQGSFVVTRMALLAPERIQGLVLLGTSMDYESADSRAKGAWDAGAYTRPLIDKWSHPSPDFELDDTTCELIASVGFGAHCTPEKVALWTGIMRGVYRGDEGRRKARMALMALLTRDGLLIRLRDVRCPVHWLQGENSGLYDRIMPLEQISMFTSAPWTELTFIQDGGHYLSDTNPVETAEAMLKMLERQGDGVVAAAAAEAAAAEQEEEEEQRI